MMIDEAIEKHRKIAETKKTLYDACILKEYNRHLLREYKEHEQLAECLEELKELREIKSKIDINSQHRLYRIWQMMKQRCNNENAENYKYYGGRGICVCDKWEKDFSIFALWSFANGYKDDLTIDRIDSYGDYSPNNCRWISKKEQTNNRNSNTKYTYNGETHTLSEWADMYGISKKTFYTRWLDGKRNEKLFEPVRNKKANRKPIEYNGKAQTVKKWAKEYNINYATLIRRLDTGMSIDLALTKPIDTRFRNERYGKIAEQLKEGVDNETN